MLKCSAIASGSVVVVVTIFAAMAAMKCCRTRRHRENCLSIARSPHKRPYGMTRPASASAIKCSYGGKALTVTDTQNETMTAATLSAPVCTSVRDHFTLHPLISNPHLADLSALKTSTHASKVSSLQPAAAANFSKICFRACRRACDGSCSKDCRSPAVAVSTRSPRTKV